MLTNQLFQEMCCESGSHMGQLKFMSMSAISHNLEIDGNKARGRAYCRELIFPQATAQKVVIGYFDDEYVKQDGRWLFSSRIYHVIGTSDT